MLGYRSIEGLGSGFGLRCGPLEYHRPLFAASLGGDCARESGRDGARLSENQGEFEVRLLEIIQILTEDDGAVLNHGNPIGDPVDFTEEMGRE